MSTADNVLLGIAIVIALPATLLAYLTSVEAALGLVRQKAVVAKLRPWLWLLPGCLLVGSILAYPLIDTIILSFSGPTGSGFVGAANFHWVFSVTGALPTLETTGLWLLLVPALTVFFGVVFASVADRVWYERMAKSVVIIPTAMSFVAGVAVWEIVYAEQPAGTMQTGIANLVWAGLLRHDPEAWLINNPLNDFALIAIAVWMYLGFATLVLSAALKGVPQDQIESARMDGASELKVFWYVVLPNLRPAIAVVATTTLAWSLKIFDVVYVATGGRFGTDVVGTRVFEELFTYQDIGKGSALAVVLFLAVLPIMVLSARRVRSLGGA